MEAVGVELIASQLRRCGGLLCNVLFSFLQICHRRLCWFLFTARNLLRICE